MRHQTFSPGRRWTQVYTQTLNTFITALFCSVVLYLCCAEAAFFSLLYVFPRCVKPLYFSFISLPSFTMLLFYIYALYVTLILFWTLYGLLSTVYPFSIELVLYLLCCSIHYCFIAVPCYTLYCYPVTLSCSFTFVVSKTIFLPCCTVFCSISIYN